LAEAEAETQTYKINGRSKIEDGKKIPDAYVQRKPAPIHNTEAALVSRCHGPYPLRILCFVYVYVSIPRDGKIPQIRMLCPKPHSVNKIN
jgi:hypothetical protein